MPDTRFVAASGWPGIDSARRVGQVTAAEGVDRFAAPRLPARPATRVHGQRQAARNTFDPSRDGGTSDASRGACFLLDCHQVHNRRICRPMPHHRYAQEARPVVNIGPTGEWPDFDLPPSVPTLEEIEIADELRHDLELKYLGKADPCWDSGTAHSRRRKDDDD
jgi:hypothetical protein